MKIITLSSIKYKEKDAIVDAISENQAFSFLVRGAYSKNAKNAFLTNPLTVADVTFMDGNYRYQILKESTLISSPMSDEQTLENMSFYMLLGEATSRLLQEEEKAAVFPLINDCINLNKKSKKHLMLSIFYLAKILKIGGYDFEVNHCVFCGSKKSIKLFSFDDGGFVCSDCASMGYDQIFSVSQMKILYWIFSSLDINLYIKQNFSNDDCIEIFKNLFRFVDENFGYKLKSYHLLYK